VPQYSAIIIASPPEVYMTSRPYAVEALDSLLGSVEPRRTALWPQPYTGEQVTTAVEPMDISRFGGKKSYTAPADNVITAMEPVALTRFGGKKDYDAPADAVSTAVEPLEITRYGAAVTYPVPPEAVITAVDPIEITRSTP
jgi:hypothetical protein